MRAIHLIAGSLAIILAVPATVWALRGMGPPFVVSGNASRADVASDASGNFVVVWENYLSNGVRGRRFTSAGAALGDAFDVAASGYGAGVARHGAGDFLVVWQDYDLTSGPTVFGRHFDAQGAGIGQPLTAAILESPPEDSTPAVAEIPGGFVVAWSDYDYPNGYRLRGQRVTDGNLLDGGVLPLANDALTPDAAPNAGRFVVVWSDYNDYSLRGESFTPAGSSRGTFHVSDTGYFPDVAVDASGNFVVVWQEYAAESALRAQRFDTNGDPREQSCRIVDDGGFPAIAPAGNGKFVVVWTDYSAPAAQVVGRLFSDDGVCDSSTTTTTTTPGTSSTTNTTQPGATTSSTIVIVTTSTTTSVSTSTSSTSTTTRSASTSSTAVAITTTTSPSTAPPPVGSTSTTSTTLGCPSSGFDGALCELGRLSVATLCGAETVDASVRQLVDAKLAKVRGLLEAARSKSLANGKPKAVNAPVKAAGKQLQALVAKVTKAAKRKKLSASCAQTIGGRVGGLRQAVLGLRV